MNNKFEVVEVDDPLRCQAVHGNGQCRYKAVPNSSYCSMHGGNKAQQAATEKAKRSYWLAKWQASVDTFADEDAAKSLRGEIGITRLLLQEMVSRCKDSNELILYSGKIGEMVGKIERLVVSCHKLESNLGMLLDKSAAMNLATQMIEIISKYVTDDEAIGSISNEIASAIVATQGRIGKE